VSDPPRDRERRRGGLGGVAPSGPRPSELLGSGDGGLLFGRLCLQRAPESRSGPVRGLTLVGWGRAASGTIRVPARRQRRLHHDLRIPLRHRPKLSTLPKTARTWTGARTPSGLKRVRQAEARREVLQPRRSAAKTLVAKALRVSAQPNNGSDANVALLEALSALDR